MVCGNNNVMLARNVSDRDFIRCGLFYILNQGIDYFSTKED